MEPDEAPPTLQRLFQAFLSEQIRLLSQTDPLPSPAWRAANNAAADGLSSDAIEYALDRARDAAGQHCRRVYTPQATRMLSERIESDYLDSLHENPGNADGGVSAAVDHDLPGAVDIEADLTDIAAVAALPREWPAEQQQSTPPADASRYAALVEQLSILAQRRQLTQARVERLQRTKAMLRPFGEPNPPPANSEDATETSLQQNILTRGCQLERELERMKVLLARVGGRVADLPAGRNTGPAAAYREPPSWRNSLSSKADHIGRVFGGDF